MARRRKGKKRGGKSKAIPLAPIMPAAFVVVNDWKATGGDIKSFLNEVTTHTTGYNPKLKEWNYLYAAPFWGGTVAGIIVHKVANKTINRYIRKATMGYISL